jgi:hypothetical protein
MARGCFLDSPRERPANRPESLHALPICLKYTGRQLLFGSCRFGKKIGYVKLFVFRDHVHHTQLLQI